MFELLLKVDGKNLTSINNNKLIKGSYNIDSLVFEFSENWNNFDKTAIFIIGENTYNVAILNNKCIIPEEVYLANEISIGVFGTITENQVLKHVLDTNLIYKKIYDGSYILGDEPENLPTQTQWNLYIAEINNLLLQSNATKEQCNVILNEIKALKVELTAQVNEVERKLAAGEFKGDKGDKGDTGPQGIQGPVGPQGIQGIQGVQGIQGEPFSIFKVYSSIQEMNNDINNVPDGKFVIISSSVESEDNAKLYVKSNNSFNFIVDLSGMTGIQGPQGVQGIQGPKPVVGVDYFTSQDKATMVSQITDDATSVFNTNASAKTTSFNENAETKTTAYNSNAESKTTEFNSNATTKLAEFNSSANVQRITTLESENQEQDKLIKDLYNSVPTKTATSENEEISITDAQATRTTKSTINGKTVQGDNPTPTNPQEISNLSGTISFKDTNNNLINIDDMELGGINEQTGIDYDRTDRLRTKNYINVSENTSYTLNNEETEKRWQIFYYYKQDGTFISALSKNIIGKNTITTPSETAKIRVCIITTTPKNLMLNIGTEVLHYEPFGNNVAYINLQGNKLCKNGTVADKLLIDLKGNVAIEKNIAEIVLNGSENVEINQNNEDNIYFLFPKATTPNLVRGVPITSNYFTYASPQQINTITDSGYWGPRIGIEIAKSVLESEDVNGFKQWLSTHNTTVQYVLSTPTIINLSKIEPLYTLKGTNYITIESSVGSTDFEVEYVEDLQKHLENIENRLSLLE